MSALKTLVMMQLKEKLNLKNKKFKSKKTLFNVIFTILKFAMVVALCYLILFFCNYLGLFSLINQIPRSVITVVFTLMMIISIISATLGLNKSMYYSFDNPVLLTLPCRPTQVYLSKLIVFYIFEVIKNMSFMVPLFIAYGLISGFGLLYYPWVLFCFIFISMIPVLIGAILSIPTMWFYNFFRPYKRLQAVTLIVIVTGVTFAVVAGISLIPENIDLVKTWGTTYWQIQDFLAQFVTKFKIFDDTVLMIVGKRIGLINKVFTIDNIINFALMLLFIVALFFVGLITAKPLFYKMASKPFEYRKGIVKEKKNVVSNKMQSIIKTEFKLNLRNAEKVFTNVGVMIALPILVFFLNKIFAAMNTRMLGNNMAIAFNVLIILLVALTSSSYAASVFSKDGRSSYLIKVQPSKFQPLLISKLLFNTIFMMVSFVATFIVLLMSTNLGLTKCLIIILSIIFIYFAHLFYSAELDIMNPQIELYATIGANENNPNETKSTLVAFLAAFLTFGMMLFLLIEDPNLFTYIKILAIGLVMMLFRGYMLLNKIKLYYKEK